MQKKQRAMKIRYPTSREKLMVPNPLAPGYMGTYSPSPKYLPQVPNDHCVEKPTDVGAGNRMGQQAEQ